MIKTKKIEWAPLTSYLLLLAFVVLTLVVTYVLYLGVQDMFKVRLQEQIKSVAATAAAQFEELELSSIQGPESVGSALYESTVKKLQKIRESNPDIKYIYILRKTKNNQILEFVADADSIDPSAEIDLNKDGVIDESDALNWPGDPYDVSEYYYLQFDAFRGPTVDPDLTNDQWGTFMSSTAPIQNTHGAINSIIGLDIAVRDFNASINRALVPFILYQIFLLLTLTLLTVRLVGTWSTQLEIIKELDRQKDELLGLVSHQLAAPVSAIRWYIEMLLDGDLGVLTPQQQEQLRTVQGSTQNLNDLVSMILDVSRVQLGRVRIEKQELDLGLFFKEIIDVVEPKAIEKKIEFVKSIPANFPNAMLDKRYTRMTIENLMTNAIKYTPENGKVSVTVTHSEGIMRVVVKDNGYGIPLADQKNIFGKMFRASNVRNGSIDGNGFGLYVAKGAVESQGGKIWFESAEGKGTTFYVTLPLNSDSPANS